MITLRQLRYFDALTVTLHFGKAASTLNVTQPALSMQIRELEAHLGVKLCERRGRGVVLTAEGQEIAKKARQILRSVQDLEDSAQAYGPVLGGSFRLGIIPTVAPYVLPLLLPQLDEAYPDLHLTVREAQTPAVTADLESGKLDAMVIALPTLDDTLRAEPLFDDEFYLAAPAAALSGASRANALEVLDPERLLLLDEGHCLRDQALSFCELVSDDMADSFGASSLTTLLHLVANNRGMTLLPKLCAQQETLDDRIALLSFPDPAPCRQIGLVWRHTSARTDDFMALAECLRRAHARAVQGGEE